MKALFWLVIRLLANQYKYINFVARNFWSQFCEFSLVYNFSNNITFTKHLITFAIPHLVSIFMLKILANPMFFYKIHGDFG